MSSQHDPNRRARSPFHYGPSPTSHGLPSHTLPPLPTSGYVSPNADHVYQSHTSSQLITSRSEVVTQPGSFPVYAPTASTFYQPLQYGSNGHPPPTYHHAPQSQASMSSAMPLQSQSPLQPGYTSTSRTLPDLAPMPTRVNGSQITGFGLGGGFPQQEEKPQRAHVVGAQGRRGILPSSAGRPSAVVGDNTTGQKAANTPAKNADGKYPCDHCEKTYLHAKHLKRHLLRHTGVRPYTCGLCHDTFSRSDILKRHFVKCSERRGNPSGENHLTHSRSQKKAKEEQGPESTGAGTPTVPDHPPMGNYATANMEPSYDFNNLSLAQSNYGDNSNQVSRANSVKGSRRSNGTQSNRASLGMVNTSGYESTSYAQSTGYMTPDSVTTSGVATPYTHHHETRSSLDNGAFTHAINGNSAFASTSRPSTSSNYNHTSLPHIVGQDSGRDHGNMAWPSFSHYQPFDEYGHGQHHSGSSTPAEPLDREKHHSDYSALPPTGVFYTNQQKP